MLIFRCNFLWKNVVSVLHAHPTTPAMEPVPKLQKNMKQVWQGSGELTKHMEQLMDSGELPPSAVTLGTLAVAVGLFSTQGVLPVSHSCSQQLQSWVLCWWHLCP